MSNAIATRSSGTALTFAEGQTEFTPGQVATLRQLGVDQATREDLAIFFHQSVRTGLDPFARQIYMIGRWDSKSRGMKYTIQTGIDGYRLIARRAADRARETLGYEDAQWCGEDGVWRDVWLSSTPPAAARVVVIRNGQRFPATALWSEYVQTNREGNPTSMWARMSSTMLAKCAEALALRKAFPQDLSGIYTTDEMAQAQNEAPAPEPAPEPEPQPSRTRQRKAAQPEPEVVDAEPERASKAQIAALVAELDRAGYATKEQKSDAIAAQLGERKSANELTPEQAVELAMFFADEADGVVPDADPIDPAA